jgi:hypothetical protein
LSAVLLLLPDHIAAGSRGCSSQSTSVDADHDHVLCCVE